MRYPPLVLIVFVGMGLLGNAQVQRSEKRTGSALVPRPAISSILEAFDTYEIVGIPEAHEMKDVDDFILSLIRTPAFSEKVNDIAVECGNSLYQPTLDRYIAGEDVPFAAVQKVWRDTTQPMCGESGFFEELFPLVRAINQKLPAGKRLRVLATDPPIDWNQVKNSQDIAKFEDRDASMSSVMEREVLSKHRKALALFGIFHLLHGAPGDAVTLYEKQYPNRTFVLSDLGYYGADSPSLFTSGFATWRNPSLALAKGTRLGGLGLNAFLPSPISTDKDCNVVDNFAKTPRKPMAEYIDGFLYLGPVGLRLREQVPADIALDSAYIREQLRREELEGFSGTGTLKEYEQRIISSAADPIYLTEKLSDPEVFYPMIKQACLDRRHLKTTPD